MEGWHPDGYPGNLAYSPELWEWMFALGLYLNFDPSHLLWLGIDPVARAAALRRPRRARAGQGHPSVTRTSATATASSARPSRATTRGTRGGGATGSQASVTSTSRGVIDALYEGGFDGTVSVEHEDPVWGGDPDRVRTGSRSRSGRFVH